MGHGTTLLFGLAGVAVREVSLRADGGRVVDVVTDDETAAACPTCGVFSSARKGKVVARPKDLPYGEMPLGVRWHKSRWRCREPRCPRQSFTETIAEVPAGARTTGRLRRAVADGVADNRCVSEVAASYGLSWPTAQRAVAARAAEQARPPAPTPVLGIDETRRERARWVPTADGGWRRTDPWETELVDLATGQGLVGQVGGRSGASVEMWLAEQSEAFRDTIRYVALDPSAPYASAVHRLLPQATVVVDHFHLVQLANRAVTKVRQRVTQQQLGRRGRRTDPVWANRRMLLRARERLSERAFTRMWNGAVDNDPSGQLLAAWIAKEELRALLGCAARGGQRPDIAHRLTRFYDWCARSDIPEVTTLAQTVDTWWPEILAFLQTGITNAGTEGTNRLVKQVLRCACGFRNTHNYRMRVRLHCARQRASARALPAQR